MLIIILITIIGNNTQSFGSFLKVFGKFGSRRPLFLVVEDA